MLKNRNIVRNARASAKFRQRLAAAVMGPAMSSSIHTRITTTIRCMITRTRIKNRITRTRRKNTPIATNEPVFLVHLWL
jgi:hypothetical protein